MSRLRVVEMHLIKRLIYKLIGILPARVLRIFPPDELIKFCVVGGIGAIIGLGILYALTEWLGLFYVISGSIGWIIVSYLVYIGNCGWTFQSFLGIRGFGKFLASRSVTTIVGSGLAILLTSGFGIWYMASPVITAAAMALINFLAGKRWIWRKPENPKEKRDFPPEKA